MILKRNRVVVETLLYVFSLLTFIHIGISVFNIITSFAPDFSVFYIATRALLNNTNPYTAYDLYTGVGYPVFSLLFFIPFTLFSYTLSQGIFIILSVACVFISVYLSLSILRWKISFPYYLSLSSLAFLMFPTKFTLGMGQSNSIMLTILLLGFYFFTQNKKNISGMLFGLGLVIKPITVFVAIFFLLKKQWKILFFSMLTLMMLLIVSVVFFDWSYYNYYLTNTLPHLFNLSGREIYYNQGIMGFISRITDDNFKKLLLHYSLSLSIFIISIYYLKKIKDVAVGFSLFLIMLVLFDTLSWQHHFIFLLFPCIVILKKVLHDGSRLSLIVLISSYILVSLNIKNPQEYYSPFVLSHVFIGTIYLLILFIFVYDRKIK